eukprot:69992-Pyramimonas_sp.AAC.1
MALEALEEERERLSSALQYIADKAQAASPAKSPVPPRVGCLARPRPNERVERGGASRCRVVDYSPLRIIDARSAGRSAVGVLLAAFCLVGTLASGVALTSYCCIPHGLRRYPYVTLLHTT